MNTAVKLPNFLIIGAQKGGTTWLWHTLAKHPDVFMPNGEVMFFDKPDHFEQGLDWYQQHFQGVTHESAIGEKSPGYLWLERNTRYDTAQSIHRYASDIKLIAVLRNPVERAISHARHHMRSATFGKGSLSPFASLDQLIFDSHLSQGILSRGYYARQLEGYYKYFKPEQLLVVVNEEEIKKEPRQLMERVCNFVEVDPDFDFGLTVTGKGSKKIHDGSLSRTGVVLSGLMPSMGAAIRKLDRHTLAQKFSLSVSQSTRRALYDLYAEENEKLFDLLGRRWSSWCDRN